MTTEKWLQIEKLYHGALELDQSERSAYLAEACNGDTELRDEVQALLNYDEQAGSFIEGSALELVARDMAADAPPEEPPDSSVDSVIPRQIGKYRLLNLLGKGGMGEVYLALDTRLNRKVAIKLLPRDLSSNSDLVRRFEQEAQAVSALNHPNIVTIFEFGIFENRYFIVTEYVDGETLLQRVAASPGNRMRLSEGLNVAAQVATALQAAHKAGIVHRDIKLENVMLRTDGLVKVLDFGLAKSIQTPSIVPPIPNGRITNSGIVMGTVDYMSPEQMRGETIDYRTDIFSLGVLLYELLSGRSPFEAATTSDVIVSVLSKDPVPLSDVAPDIPQALHLIVARCLEKRPEDRFQSAGDLAFALQAFNPAATAGARIGAPTVRGLETRSTAPATWRRLRQAKIAWPAAAVIATMLLVGAILGLINYRRDNAARLAATFNISSPTNWGFRASDTLAVSPDGKYIVFSATRTGNQSNGNTALWLRALDSADAKLLAGTEAATFPFWSPNSRYVAFMASGALKKIDITNGSIVTLCEADYSFPGTWSTNGDILFSAAQPSEVKNPALEWAQPKIPATNGTNIRIVSELGGQSREARQLAEGERAQYNPRFLPDGKHFLYYSRNQDSAKDGIYVASLDQRENRKLVLKDARLAEYVSSGHLLFNKGNTLFAQRFSTGSFDLTGEPIKVAEHAATYGGNQKQSPYTAFSASDSGVLVWRPQTDNAGDATQLVWYDREGNPLSKIGEPARYSGPALSPDETHLAVAKYDEAAKSRDIWIINLTLGLARRLTTEPADDLNPAWSADGKWIYYTSTQKGNRNIYRKRADGSGGVEVVLESEDDKNVEDVSADGRFLIFNWHPKGKSDQLLMLLPLNGTGQATNLTSGSSGGNQALFSPDGRLVAYRATGEKPGICVKSVGSNVQPTALDNGGVQPRWDGNGKELFYLKDNTLMAVSVDSSGSRVSLGAPATLFKVSLESEERRNRYLVTKDGQHFLVVAKTDSATESSIAVKLDWQATTKQ